MWAAVAAGLLAASFTLHHGIWLLRFWAGLSMFTGIAPPVISFVSARRIARAERRAAAGLPAPRRAAEAVDAVEADDRAVDEAEDEAEPVGPDEDGTAAGGPGTGPERELAELLEPAPAGGGRKGGR